MPIHNEENNLLYSLPTLFSLNPDQIIIIFDRCSDRSREIIESSSKMRGYKGNLLLVDVDEDFPDWRYRVARLFRMGFELSKNDTILTMAADIVLDLRIKDFVSAVQGGDVRLVSFGLKYYPVDLTYFVKRLVTFVFPARGFSGVFLFSKKAWKETEDEEAVKRIPKAQDTFLSSSIKKRYATKHVWSNIIHLRHRKDARDQYLRGVMAHRISKKSLPVVFVSSVIYLSPFMLKGYIVDRERARRKLT